MKKVYERSSNHHDLSKEVIDYKLSSMNLRNKSILVQGDVETSTPKFLEENPGFRCSLIYIDVDIERPTYYSLKYLWDRLLPGGVIIFDEYEYHKFSESTGVEKFLADMKISYNIKSTNFMCPTSYMVKTVI